jgi:mannan endo-1,4-beta-mannosidase
MKKGVPLIVGEFAADHGTAGNVDEDTILSQCATLGVGYLGWSWSGNSSDLSTLDITTNFNVSSLTTWGKRLIEGTNGIKASAAVCSVFQ